METHAAITAVWQVESAKIIAALARIVRDLDLAHDLAQDALLKALETWPETGIPDNPGAWLMTAAKHRAIDHFRRLSLHLKKEAAIVYDLESAKHWDSLDFSEHLEDEQNLLMLMFTTCHPLLSPDSRAALTLRLLGGLETPEIAKAYLLPEPTIAQRLVRAKRALKKARIRVEPPALSELPQRLASVLEVLYLIFNEGYSASHGPSWTRPSLCEDALRLTRSLAARMPGEPEVHALLALMELQSSRLNTRIAKDGKPILLMDQDRSRWDQMAIHRGLASLSQAESLTPPPAPYLIQAKIAACHAQAKTPESTDWPSITDLYSELLTLNPSPVIALNRAVAVSMSQGPAAALKLVDALSKDPALQAYHFVPAVRADLLAKLGRIEEAKAELQRAADMTSNEAEKNLMLERSRSLKREP